MLDIIFTKMLFQNITIYTQIMAIPIKTTDKLTLQDWELINSVKNAPSDLVELIKLACHESNEKSEQYINRIVFNYQAENMEYKQEYVRELIETYELLQRMLLHLDNKLYMCIIKGCYCGDQGLCGWKLRHPGRYAAIELFTNQLRSKGWNPEIKQVIHSGGLEITCNLKN